MNSYLSSAERCLTMCGLDAFADAMVGSLGVEQRKRTTIGVELAAKASVSLMSGSCCNNFLYSHNCSFFWMSQHQGLIHKVLGLSWRFYAALRIMDNQFCARECPNHFIMLNFLICLQHSPGNFRSQLYSPSIAKPVSSLPQNFSR